MQTAIRSFARLAYRPFATESLRRRLPSCRSTDSASAGGVTSVVLPLLLLTLLALPLCAQDEQRQPGQEDLDQATVVKIQAKQMSDLEKVVDLCEAALAKGLDKENQGYAEDLLTATLYEQAARLSRLIFDQQPADPQWPRIRQMCLPKLQRALEIRPQMGDALLLTARLHTLPGGDRSVAEKSVEQAIPLLADEPDQASTAYLVRAGLQQEPENVLADLNKALELNPRNLDAWRVRGVYYLTQGDFDKALQDLNELLTRNPDDLLAHQAIAQTLRQTKQYDEALKHLDHIIAANPKSSLAYNLRARIAEDQGHLDEAIDALNNAIRVEPRDLGAILGRARLRIIQEQYDLAGSDIHRALQVQPGLPQAILLRSLAAAGQKRFGEAIGDLEQLVRRSGTGTAEIKMQMATYYEMDRRPRKAIEVYTEILADEKDNWMALRRRGDAYLSVGNHADAIRDYDAARALRPDEAGILNNLAWVLATSPEDTLRDGKRALEIAQKACTLTEHKLPHILSTLAASYAESGDFDQAVKWSEQAVALDPSEEQLAKELASYRVKKPWRELQEVEENPAELVVPQPDDEDLPTFDLDRSTPDAGTPPAADETPENDTPESKAPDTTPETPATDIPEAQPDDEVPPTGDGG
jgi:tetratricopeptide (TPR) repeat protein